MNKDPEVIDRMIGNIPTQRSAERGDVLRKFDSSFWMNVAVRAVMNKPDVSSCLRQVKHSGAGHELTSPLFLK